MNYLSEIPWWIPAGLLMVGLAFLWAGNNRQEKKLMRGGLAALLAAALLAAVSYALESDREQVARHTRELITSIEKHDWPTMQRLMDPEVSFVVLKGRDQIVAMAQKSLEHSQLESLRIASLNTQSTDPSITVLMQVAANTREGSGITNWQLEWEKSGKEWLLVEATPLGGPVIPESMVTDYIKARARQAFPNLLP